MSLTMLSVRRSNSQHQLRWRQAAGISAGLPVACWYCCWCFRFRASNTSGTGCPGLLNGTGANANLNNDLVLEDIMIAKAGYPGGKLSAAYTAGTDDTSCWEVFFEGQQPGSPGKAHLVE